MIFYDYVRKNLLIAALLQDIFGRISQVIAVLSLGQQSLVRMKICTIWDSWQKSQYKPSKRQKKIKCSSPVKTSQYPNNIGQQLHSMLRIQFLQGLETILVPIRIPADIGYLGVISSKTAISTRKRPSHHSFKATSLKPATQTGNLHGIAFQVHTSIFHALLRLAKKTCPGETGKGENLSPSIWDHFNKKTQRFHIN